MKKRKQKPKGQPQRPPQPELNQASRAQLGPDQEKRPYRPREDDASIEDPLRDWPKEDG